MATKNEHFEKLINSSLYWLDRLAITIKEVDGGVIVTQAGKSYGVAGYDPDDVDEAAFRRGIKLQHIFCVDGWDAVDAVIAQIRA